MRQIFAIYLLLFPSMLMAEPRIFTWPPMPEPKTVGDFLKIPPEAGTFSIMSLTCFQTLNPHLSTLGLQDFIKEGESVTFDTSCDLGFEPVFGKDLQSLFLGADVTVERLLEVYETYSPGAEFSDFVGDNPQFVSAGLDTPVPARTNFFVPRVYCMQTLENGTNRQFEMSDRTIDGGQGNVPVRVLLKSYQKSAPNAEFAQFLECNRHLDIRSETATVPSGVTFWAPKFSQ